MRQLTLRLPDDLVVSLKDIASKKGHSLNAWARLVLSASADPEMADSEAARLKERFERAGLLLSQPPSPVGRPPDSEVRRARTAAGEGRPLASYISEGRR